MFISIDGIDGTGKSTQVNLLAEWLRSQGRSVVECVDPGETAVGLELRRIVLDNRHDMSVWTEALLFMASRVELVNRVISPALAEGKVVVSDRFLLANVVYQGHAGGLDVERLWQFGREVIGGLMPDLTVILDLPVAAATERRGRPADRMEAKDLEYRERVRAGFLAESERIPAVVIDASPGIEEVHEAIREVVKSRARSDGGAE